MRRLVDIINKKFTRLLVIERTNNIGNKTAYRCVCDCGAKVVVTYDKLSRGSTKSCGCYSKDVNRERLTTHGMQDTRLYSIWKSMKNRCSNKKYHRYRDYGGRGIFVCEEWMESFENFNEWALANGYRDELTIERADNNGSYSPNNCKWSTLHEQMRNTRHNVWLTYKGETKILQDWANITGLDRRVISMRINRYGWSVEKALTTLNMGAFGNGRRVQALHSS